MFTGIIEEYGIITAIRLSDKQNKIQIKAKKVTSDAHLGDSIAVNGVCLTISELNNDTFVADISPETLSRTNLKDCLTGTRVNLERALPATGRFGGHIVSGHIDGTAQIQSVTKEKNSLILCVKPDPSLLKYIAIKGSITIDGISLTVTDSNRNTFSTSIIPHTLKHTTLDFKKTGDIVNIECDLLSKYLERLMHFSFSDQKSEITTELLKSGGFL